MGRRCFVPNCTSGYDSNKEKISVFSVPKDEELLNKWRKVIPRNDRILSSKDKICEKHFDSDDIIKEWSCGVNTIPLQRYYLKKDAVPCIFLNCPKYLTKVPKKRRTIMKHKLPVAKKTRAAVERHVTNYDDFDTKTGAVTVQTETSILDLSGTQYTMKRFLKKGVVPSQKFPVRQHDTKAHTSSTTTKAVKAELHDQIRVVTNEEEEIPIYPEIEIVEQNYTLDFGP